MENLTYNYNELLPNTKELLHTSINIYHEALEELKLIHHLFSPSILFTKQQLLNFLFTFQLSIFTSKSNINKDDLISIINMTETILQHFLVSHGNFAMKVYNKLYLAKSLLMQVDSKLFSISN